MAESSEQCDLNTFKENTNSKVVEKEAINSKNTESAENSAAAAIAFDIDEDIAKLQSDTIKAVANSMQSNQDFEAGEIKESNLEIEAALNRTIGRNSEEATSSGVPDRASRSDCHLAAYFAEETAEDGRLVIAMGEDLMDGMSATIDVLRSHIDVFAGKAVEASGRGTERGYSVADFYNSMISRYEAAIVALERRSLNVEIALRRVRECVEECVKYAGLAERVTDETLDESRRTKFAACWWNNKGKATIIVTLKKERAAIYMMRRIWRTIRDDMIEEDLSRTDRESDEEIIQCENRERKTKIGHIVATFLGLALISITSLFKPWSDSFNAILVLGLLTTGWCVVYWSIKVFKCLKKIDNQLTPVAEIQRPDEDKFIQNCKRRLTIVNAHLRKYNVIIPPENESDTDSESTTFDDAAQ